jgi:hypothetical protein
MISAEAEMEKARVKKLEDLNTRHQADLAAKDAQLKALQEQLQRYVGLRSRGADGCRNVIEGTDMYVYLYRCMYGVCMLYYRRMSTWIWAMLHSVVEPRLMPDATCFSMCMAA